MIYNMTAAFWCFTACCYNASMVRKRRRAIHQALKEWSGPPALGAPPEVVTEPFTVMLWGITSDSVAAWLSSGG
ncbi:MAG TPA: hypothetical protein PKE45_14105, partial [Caldilineaceae bacterium]|nr:hypothetical protein [Caldilineaceae bacterium]